MAVSSGQRPDLTVITGPETLVSLIKGWISRCWHQDPDFRPTFAGI